jgi:hypothetical protein
MSETARRAVLRFGPTFDARVPRYWAGSSVYVWCDVLDVLTATQAGADGLTLRWLSPTGVEFQQPGTAAGTGIWRGVLAPVMPGTWRVRAEVTGGAVIAETSLDVVATNFGATEAAPLIVTDEGALLVLGPDGSGLIA